MQHVLFWRIPYISRSTRLTRSLTPSDPRTRARLHRYVFILIEEYPTLTTSLFRTRSPSCAHPQKKSSKTMFTLYSAGPSQNYRDETRHTNAWFIFVHPHRAKTIRHTKAKLAMRSNGRWASYDEHIWMGGWG